MMNQQSNIKTVAIYYIATNIYKQYFDDFYRTLKYFLPNYKKIVVLLTDDDEDIYKKDDIVWSRIDHYPWPIITLYKMFHIKNHLYDADYHFYFNANVVFKEFKDFSNVIDVLENNKLLLGYHWIMKKDGKNDFDNSLPYVQAAYFGGSTIEFSGMCNEIIENLNVSMNKYHRVPEWHDETLLNRYFAEHNNKCSVIFMDYYIDLLEKTE